MRNILLIGRNQEREPGFMSIFGSVFVFFP